MENERLLSCLSEDFTRLRQIAAPVLSAGHAPRVPSCPEWTLDDLVQHVGMVYLHKVANMRTGAPAEWPPPDLASLPALSLLDRGYAELTAEFAARKPDERTFTWFEPDQTVGFWIRRMAQETVIHRVDAELAVGTSPAEIPDDLAQDGVDEVLTRFLGYGSVAWHEEFAGVLPAQEEAPVLIRAGDRGWLVHIGPAGVQISSAPPGSDAAAVVSGAPGPVLLWLWRRAESGVERAGDPRLVERLWAALELATQ